MHETLRQPPKRGERVADIAAIRALPVDEIIGRLRRHSMEFNAYTAQRASTIARAKAILRNTIAATTGQKANSPAVKGRASDIVDALESCKPLDPDDEQYRESVNAYVSAAAVFDAPIAAHGRAIDNHVCALPVIAEFVFSHAGVGCTTMGHIIAAMKRLPHEFETKRGMWTWMGLGVVEINGKRNAQGNLRGHGEGSLKIHKYNCRARTAAAFLTPGIIADATRKCHYMHDTYARRVDYEMTKLVDAPVAITVYGDDGAPKQKDISSGVAASRAKRYCQKRILHDLYVHCCIAYGKTPPPPMPDEFEMHEPVSKTIVFPTQDGKRRRYAI